MWFWSFALFLIAVVPALAADPDALLGAAGSEENRKQVISLLQENRRTYGDDAAILQGLLLIHAIQADAVLASEAAITGFENVGERRFVSFRVVSGTVFNDHELSRNQRLERIWHSVLERTLRRYPTFHVNGDGIAVEIQYNHRPYVSMAELYRTIDAEGTVERAKFYILTTDLQLFLERRVDAQELLEHSRIFLDEAPIKISLEEPSLVGPPRPNTLP